MVHPGAAPLSEDEIQTLRAAIAERGDYESARGRADGAQSPRDDYFDTIAAR
jgi:hypothetical protein